MGAPPEDDEEDVDIAKLEGTAYTWMEVALWKLNSTCDVSKDGRRILNWRRRYFYLQEYESRLALMYTSEKENGSLHLGCIVSEKGVDKTTRKILPKVELEPVDENRKEKLILSMKEY